MSKDRDILNRACEQVSVLDAASSLGYELQMGANRSPFREDRKPSFAVLHDGRYFKDYASGTQGGSWNFCTLAKPDWAKKRIAEYLIDLAGLSMIALRDRSYQKRI